MQVELDVVPQLDVRATTNLIHTLGKTLRQTQRGMHVHLQEQISSVYDQLIKSGYARTPTEARLLFTKLAGGSFSEKNVGILRGAAGLTATKLATAKRSEQISAKYEDLQAQLIKFRESPTAEGRISILKTVSSIERLMRGIDKSMRKLPYDMKQVMGAVTGIKKEVSDWDIPNKEQDSVQNQLWAFTKKMLGITTLAGTAASFVKKGFQAIGLALQRGEQAMRLQAAYGKDIDWRDIRARAGIFNMSPEEAAAPNQYASDFQQRMMWGEISEREIIGLSRAGRWGRMVMSGEAKRNPEAANRAFEELVANTDEAKMRSILRQVGLPQGLMQYNIQGYDETTKSEYFQKFGEVAEKEWQAAVMMYDAGNQFQLFSEQISEAMAYVTATTVATASPQGKNVAARLGVNRVLEPTTGFNVLTATPAQIRESVGWGNTNNINQTVNNNIVIQGNADSNTIDALRDEMSRPQAISSWFEQAQIMGGRTTY